jgi:hypothetical protein
LSPFTLRSRTSTHWSCTSISTAPEPDVTTRARIPSGAGSSIGRGGRSWLSVNRARRRPTFPARTVTYSSQTPGRSLPPRRSLRGSSVAWKPAHDTSASDCRDVAVRSGRCTFSAFSRMLAR